MNGVAPFNLNIARAAFAKATACQGSARSTIFAVGAIAFNRDCG